MQTYITHIAVYRRRALDKIFKISKGIFTLNVIVKSAPLSRRKEVASGCCAHVRCKAVIPSCMCARVCVWITFKHTYKHAYLKTWVFFVSFSYSIILFSSIHPLYESTHTHNEHARKKTQTYVYYANAWLTDLDCSVDVKPSIQKQL
jgi:hypothetical protein